MEAQRVEPLAPVPYAVVLPSIAEHGVIFPHDDMKLALTSSPSQVVANRSGPPAQYFTR
jgi:hypothetical protein